MSGYALALDITDRDLQAAAKVKFPTLCKRQRVANYV